MNIAYIGNFEPEYSTENDVRKAFEHLGHTVHKLQENKVDINTVKRVSLDSDMLLITSTWDDALPLNEMLSLYKDMAIAKKPTATLHLDTFWGKSRGGRKWWLNPMFHTAYIFTADGDYQEEWKAFGKNHIWLPPAVRHDAAKFGAFKEEYACDVAFVGSNGHGYHEDVWGYRRELVDTLRDMCKRNGWSFKNPGGDDPKINRSDDMNDFYASAKVTVGDSLCLKKESSHYFSDRQMEQWGRGSFSIMPRIDVLGDIFHGNQPFYEWGDFNMLEDLIKFYINNEKERKRITNINQKIVSVDHTYINRVTNIIETVGLLK